MVKRICLLSLLLISLPLNSSTTLAMEPMRGSLAVFQAQHVRFVEMASGLSQPLLITNANDGSGRLFVIQRAGQILIYKNGAFLSTPFLNIQPIVNSSGSEQGLLALAFHPEYETSGRFYTLHTDQNRSIVLSVFTRSGINPDQADPTSRVTLLTISKLYTNHNGGTLAFGPDGYLYLSTGDGGSGGDPENNAQNLNSLLGKILRLDVSSPSSYSIPATNPFHNSPNPSVRKEIWAYGLRNPWRFSFDRLTGDMYIGDVGQTTREEINFQAASSQGGENYGWRVMEGSLCYNPSTGCSQSGKVLPVAEYDHTLGCSVTGGHVYRGTQYQQMRGYYFYGDFCSGRVYTLHYDPVNGWRSALASDTTYTISTFGEDEQGELYLADYTSGKIYRIVYMLPPGRVSLIGPLGGITNSQPTYSWNPPQDDELTDPATWYYLWISRIHADGSLTTIHNKWYEASLVCSGGTCSINPGIALRGGNYRWWIQSWNRGGYGPWSAAMNFSLPLPNSPDAATLISPSGSVNIPLPTYTWNKVNGSSWYYLWVTRFNGDGSRTIMHNKWYEASAVCSTSTCSFTPNVTLSAGNYRWWIQTWNEGGYGPWSTAMNLTVSP